ncbi:N-acetyl-gamma-glutamyl-phosphate reductase [Halalkalibacterium halodurans]|uniref:N-acetyl-gamma-glutamyl-phosphate reductase n=1 Tax=Halalkalibacterium halodurans TaxID=86665 RepID=UPI002E2172A8|nr:N-acetyl-gamma-glutamyl-phosphate reductase [Halalkalibacterium halodurans]MED4126425.1 N-acetyl-gamma-glutamyl-phosphate reductase [Halalkalibacterium halodurans]
MKVGIVGATGYGGLELIRLLSQHPNVEEIICYSSSQEGLPLDDMYPHLSGNVRWTLKAIDPEAIRADVDTVFLATPPGVSGELTPDLVKLGLKVIDLSGDLRINEPDVYEAWYKRQAAPVGTIRGAVYGLTEWQRDEIAAAQIIANPGCYPTAVLLGLAPLVQQKWIDPKRIIIDAKSGTSGAGRNPSQITHFSEMNENFKIYQVNQHKHTPEIEQQLLNWDESVGNVTFSTHLVPMVRGIMATIYAEANQAISEKELREHFAYVYETSPFVHVYSEGRYPATKEVFGSNRCHIGVTYDERTNRITVVSVIDNLVKGAAGQAIQNYNVMNGYEETLGLEGSPLYP